MEIKYKKIQDIKPYDNNPRFNEEAIDYVANSIKEFGFKVPLVIDKNNVIITGHTRYEASKKLNLKEVPVIIADDLNEEEVNTYRLADNKVSELAVWNYDLLFEEIEEIDTEKLKLFDINDKEIDFSDEKETTETKPEENFCYKCPKCQQLIDKEDLL